MRINSEDKKSFIELSRDDFFEHPKPDPYPSVCLFISVADCGFAGIAGEIWIGYEEINPFLSDLKDCDRLRAGQATLQSMSPGEFSLTLECFDGSGHFILRYQLSHEIYFGSGPSLRLKRGVTGGFLLDMEFFQILCNEFTALFQPLS
jgi:hypothetical protein